MRIFKRALLGLLLVLIIALAHNYPKLNIVSGYASKSLASTNFISERLYSDIVESDTNMPLINLARLESADEKHVITSVFGLMERETFCRDGLGCVLINGDYDKTQQLLKPNRSTLENDLPFPYGNNGIKDTVFANVDYNQLEKAINSAFADYDTQKTRTVLVTYKGQIIGENYIEGFSPETRILGWSMTKSIVAALYGILEHQGKIDMSYRPFKELDLTGLLGKDPREFIPLNDFLRMSSGLEWDEDYASISDVNKMLFMEADMTKSQINTHYNNNNPKVWNYSSGTTNFLSGVLRKQFKTYQDYLDFPYSELIDKIGMHSMLIETDMAGNFVGSSYGWASTRDWAKFGLLHLNKGNWNGEQLFDPKWIDYITKPTEGSKEDYGAHWWLNAGEKYPDVPRDMYSANGFLGQRVFIIPSKDLVIVRTGLAKDPDFDINGFLSGVVAAIN